MALRIIGDLTTKQLKTATFKNGYSDTYKGKRDVKAGWIILDKDGMVRMSGHSLTLEAASKTANSQIIHFLPHWHIKLKAKETKISEYKLRRENAAARAEYKVEVVAI
jgi:uncharacterized protein YjbK